VKFEMTCVDFISNKLSYHWLWWVYPHPTMSQEIKQPIKHHLDDLKTVEVLWVINFFYMDRYAFRTWAYHRNF